MGSDGGLFGGAKEALFGDGGAGAAQSAAMAQQGQARTNYKTVKDLTDKATVSSIAGFERDIANQEKNIARQEKLISQIDPTIIEASQQALKLLRGEESSTLAPVRAQRDRQRQKLLNSLREQLGPGAETSTAGIQALTKFDAETDGLLAGTQQDALKNLGGLTTQFTSSRPDMFREIAGLSGFGQGESNTLFNQAQVLQGAGGQLLQTAGAEYTGAAIRGQSNAAFGNSLMSGLATAGTAYALGDPTKSTRVGEWLS